MSKNGDDEKRRKESTHINQSENLLHKLGAIRHHQRVPIHIRMGTGVDLYSFDDRSAHRRLGERRRAISLRLALNLHLRLRRVGDRDFGIGPIDNMLRLGLRLVVAGRRCRCRYRSSSGCWFGGFHWCRCCAGLIGLESARL